MAPPGVLVVLGTGVEWHVLTDNHLQNSSDYNIDSIPLLVVLEIALIRESPVNGKECNVHDKLCTLYSNIHL